MSATYPCGMTRHHALVRFPWFRHALREALGAEQIGEHRIELEPDSDTPVEVALVLDAANEHDARMRIARALARLMPWPFEESSPPDDGRAYVLICRAA